MTDTAALPALDDDTEVPDPTLTNCSINIRGWYNDSEAEAQEFANDLWAFTYNLSRYMDLSRLDRIVVGMDYHEALASASEDEGLPSEPTANEYGTGAAMAKTVIKDDELWSRVVIWGPLVQSLFDEEHEDHALAMHTFIHELVHVEDLRIFTRTYPGGWRAGVARDARDAALQTIVNPCHSEYSAQRRSAYAAPEQGLHHLSMLKSVLSDVDGQIRQARINYRFHGNVDQVWNIVSDRLAFLFQSIGYSMGHADWVLENESSHPELAARYRAEIDELKAMSKGWLLVACCEAVQPLYTLVEWTGMDVYDPLIEVAEKLLNEYRIFTSLRSERLYIDMPYTSVFDL